METVNWKALKKYVEKYGKAQLAGELGYKTSQTIEQWFLRKNVPGYMVKHLNEVLNNELSEASSKR